jgi:hypothetical protein
VRSIQVTAYSDTKCKGTLEAVLSDIAVSRPPDGILPNLRFVDLVGTTLPHGYMSLFLSSNLTSLSSYIPGDSIDYGMCDFLEDLSTGAPNLQILSLVVSPKGSRRVKLCQSALGNVTKLLPHLTTLKLPLYYLTTTVLEMLALSPLAALEFSETRNNLENAGDVRDVAGISPELNEGSFLSLRRLSICGSLPQLGGIMRNEHFPAPNITDLVIRATVAETEKSVHDFIAIIAERCTALRCLYLLLMPSSQSLSDDADPAIVWADDHAIEPLTMNALRPLSNVLQLERFSVLHSQPLDMNDDDVSCFTEKLVNLRRIVLNPTPRARQVAPRLTLLSLMHIAKHCPKIHSIALYADAASASIVYPKTVPKQLPKVYLQLGASHLNNSSRVEVIRFLSRILRPGVALKTTISIFYDTPFPATNAAWLFVTERLPLLLEVRNEERVLQKARQDELVSQLQRQTEPEAEHDSQDDGEETTDGCSPFQ